MQFVHIQNATQGNLKGVTLDIPKGKLVVFTGLSGSGKSTLLIDVLFNECQRQYLEAMGLEGIRKPLVDRIRNVSPAVLIPQTDNNRNPRSTAGTVTGLYTDLRMIYEKLGTRRCPHCDALLMAAECAEETERDGDAFRVYMRCPLCGYRMRKLTRTEFSFNTKEGACPACEGLGRVLTVNREAAIDEDRPLEAGAVRPWEAKYGEYQTALYNRALRRYGIPVPEGMTVAQFSALQRAMLLDGVEAEAVRAAFPDVPPPSTVAAGRFEGVVPLLWKRLASHEGDLKGLEAYFDSVICPACSGERLNALSRAATVNGTRLPQLSGWPLERLQRWTNQLEAALKDKEQALVADYLLDIQAKLRRFLNVGLGYLALDRQTVTLSGGELQRMRLASALDSDLTGVIYILDEPTAGLHPKDTQGLVSVLKKLRDLGNTVLVIEHDPDVMREADFIVDMGPGSGRQGGRVTGTGSLAALKLQPDSVTGRYLSQAHPAKMVYRPPAGIGVRVTGATKFNLKGIDVEIPRGCLTAVTGPSGSGKSTLVFELIAKGDHSGPEGTVWGCGQFEEVVETGASPISRMRRSNVATYSEVYGPIRRRFAATEAARSQGLTARHFSFNAPGGRCERCEGLGYVTSNLLFFQNLEMACPECGGRQFSEAVLSVRYREHSIHDVMKRSVEEAVQLFDGCPEITRILRLLMEVGLGYLELGQTLPTLSGGEGQRLRLSRQLVGGGGHNRLYLLDEPTTGLHPMDVEPFLKLLDRMVDAGNTVVVVEHSGQLIRHSDWVIDLGPGGGDEGGEVVFAGTPAALMRSGRGATARYLQ